MHQAPVNLCLLNYQAESVSLAHLVEKLAYPQIRRADSMGSLKRKIEFSLSRHLIQSALASDPKYRDLDVSIIEQKGLPPSLSFLPSKAINFSISHCGNWIGFVYSECLDDARLGFDIEIHNKKFDLTRAAYYCNQEQLAICSALDSTYERQQYLTRLWTQKEAYFKAHETPMLNPQIKSLGFTDNNSMHSAMLASQYELSVYCDTPISITTKRLSLDNQTNIVDADIDELKYRLSWT